MMFCLLLLIALVSTALCSHTPWYPLMIPIHTGGHHHRHTTHVVTHPIIHTRVLVLGDDDHHHHHQHNHGHNHLHKHGHDHDHKHNHHHKHGHKHLHQQTSSHQQEYRQTYQGRKTATNDLHKRNPNYKYYVPYEKNNYDKNESEEDNDDHYEANYPQKYSFPVSESPWKPILHYPKGYLPLRYLGIDEQRVAEVVKDAMAEIENDERKHIPLSPIGTKNYYNRDSAKSQSLQRGAVFYDDFSVAVRPIDNQPRYGAGSYGNSEDTHHKRPKTFKLNIECQCEDPQA